MSNLGGYVELTREAKEAGGPEAYKELLERYGFQKGVIVMIKKITDKNNYIHKCDVENFDIREDYYDKNGIVIIEWADMIPDYLPEERLEIKFKISEDSENTRIIIINPIGKEYEDLCEAVL